MHQFTIIHSLHVTGMPFGHSFTHSTDNTSIIIYLWLSV